MHKKNYGWGGGREEGVCDELKIIRPARNFIRRRIKRISKLGVGGIFFQNAQYIPLPCNDICLNNITDTVLSSVDDLSRRESHGDK